MKIILNFLAVVLLLSLIAAPIYFARNFAKVAGVKSESKYLVVSQIEKFPNMKLEQEGEKYQISFTKQGPSQAYLGVLIINNPTASTRTYRIERISGQAQPFFGENPSDRLIKVTVPAAASIPLSLFSGEKPLGDTQTVEFKIQAD